MTKKAKAKSSYKACSPREFLSAARDTDNLMQAGMLEKLKKRKVSNMR